MPPNLSIIHDAQNEFDTSTSIIPSQDAPQSDDGTEVNTQAPSPSDHQQSNYPSQPLMPIYHQLHLPDHCLRLDSNRTDSRLKRQATQETNCPTVRHFTNMGVADTRTNQETAPLLVTNNEPTHSVATPNANSNARGRTATSQSPLQFLM